MDILGQTATVLTSIDGGGEHLKIAGNKARGSNIICVEAWIRPAKENTGRIGMLISATQECSLTNGTEITEVTDPIPFPVANLNLLSFLGTVNGDMVQILYRV